MYLAINLFGTNSKLISTGGMSIGLQLAILWGKQLVIFLAMLFFWPLNPLNSAIATSEVHHSLMV